MKYHPSQLRSLELCPSFQRDETRDQSAAEEGRLIHRAIEKGTPDELETDEQKTMYASCMEYLKSIGAEKAKREVHLENDILSGTLDVFDRPHPQTVLVVDWKFGRKPIDEVKDNVQFQAYALLAMAADPSIRRVSVHMVVPRQQIVETHTFTREDEIKIRVRIETIVARHKENRTETPAEEACLWCGRKGTCQRLHAVAIRQGSLLPDPVVFEPGTSLVTPDYRAKAQLLATLLEDWAKQVKRANTAAVVEDGVEIPGYVLKTRRANPEITDMLAVRRMVDLPDEQFLQACTVSLGKLADTLHALKGGAKKAIQSELESKLGPLIVRGPDITYLQRGEKKK